jgi:hypothetical protein
LRALHPANRQAFADTEVTLVFPPEHIDAVERDLPRNGPPAYVNGLDLRLLHATTLTAIINDLHAHAERKKGGCEGIISLIEAHLQQRREAVQRARVFR